MKLIKIENILTVDKFPVHQLNQHNAFPDSIKVNNTVFLVFRSASKHTPETASKIIVASTKNYKEWQTVKEFISPDQDYRDPKIIYYRGKLHLYWGVVTAKHRLFLPIGILHSAMDTNGNWSDPEFVYRNKYLLSRVRRISGEIFMCVYKWDSLHPFKSESRIISSSDGVNWNENTKFGSHVEEGTESDCIEVNGRLLWIIRKDFANYSDPGSTIVLIHKNRGVVKKVFNKSKYDAPLLFTNGERVYLLSREHLANSGIYYRWNLLLSKKIRNIGSYLLYWLNNKSTALWEIELVNLSVSKILGFHSTGDTGYCGVIVSKKSLNVFNYSSSIEKQQINCRSGQNKPTSIYRYELQIYK
jgi:hypothetical protein